MLVLCGFGLLMIYSASFYSANIKYGDSFYFVKKQLIGFAIGMAFFILACNFDYHKLYKLRWWIIGVSVVLLALVFVPGIGKTNYGATRWIGIGSFTIQPSELAKYGLVIFASAYMSENMGKLRTFVGVLPILLAGGAICVLILLEPNMSVTMCVGLLMLAMLFLGGMQIKHFLLLL